MQTISLVMSDRRDKNQYILRFGTMNIGVEELLVIEHDSMNDETLMFFPCTRRLLDPKSGVSPHAQRHR